MKTWNKHKYTWASLWTLFIGALLAGCVGEEGTESLSHTHESLSISPQVTDAKTRAASDVSLNEVYLDKLDVKLFGKDDSQLRLTKRLGQATNGVATTLDQGNWKDKNHLVDGETYEVLTIANAKEDLQSIHTLVDLSKKTQEDADIWKPYDKTDNSGKTFLMSSVTDYQVTTSATQTIQASLSRAAAKILLKLSINVPGYTVGNPTWSFKNYNTATTLFGEPSTPTLFGDNTAKTLGSMGDTYESMQASKDGYIVTTYSYATEWKDHAEEMPVLIIQVPLTKTDSEAEGEGAVGETIDNFYSIPVRDKNQTELRRNHLYTIQANITSLGSSTEIVYGTPVDLKYNVMKWSEGEETLINADKQNYLLVSPTFHIMRNEKVDNKTIHFYASDACTVKIDEVYYYDKNGTKKIINGGAQYPQITIQDKATQGIIEIKSAIPSNLTVKYIKFKVKSGNLEEEVIIKQYPLKYVQNVEGAYSTKDNWINYSTNPPTIRTTNDTKFTAKVYYNNQIYSYGKTWDVNRNRPTYSRNGNQGNQSNNCMYVIQITKTESGYIIAKPSFNNLMSTDNSVSPAFMLASQLGTVSSFSNFNDAAKHCDKYIEVSADGKTYDDWRLPTKAEINSIVNFQNDTNAKETMDRVLVGYYYWAADGGKSDKVPGATVDNSPGAVRCVRDLSPEEVTELENKNE